MIPLGEEMGSFNLTWAFFCVKSQEFVLISLYNEFYHLLRGDTTKTPQKCLNRGIFPLHKKIVNMYTEIVVTGYVIKVDFRKLTLLKNIVLYKKLEKIFIPCWLISEISPQSPGPPSNALSNYNIVKH